MEVVGIDVLQSNGIIAGELTSVQELSFTFKIAASRVTEMCSNCWWWEKNGSKLFQNMEMFYTFYRI